MTDPADPNPPYLLEDETLETYRWRRLALELQRQMTNLYKWADEHDIDLPSPGITRNHRK